MGLNVYRLQEVVSANHLSVLLASIGVLVRLDYNKTLKVVQANAPPQSVLTVKLKSSVIK